MLLLASHRLHVGHLRSYDEARRFMSACGRADHRRQSLAQLEVGRRRSLSQVSRRPTREAQDSRSGQRRSVLQPRAAHRRASVGSTNLLTLARSPPVLSRQCERDILDRELAMLGLKHTSQYLRNVIYLQDMGVEISGVKFFGSPWLDKRSHNESFATRSYSSGYRPARMPPSLVLGRR